MPEDERHLHELKPGEAFIDPTSDDARQVTAIYRGRVEVTAGRSAGRTVEFRRCDGSVAKFEVAPSSRTEWWSPTTQVRPVRRNGGGHD